MVWRPACPKCLLNILHLYIVMASFLSLLDDETVRSIVNQRSCFLFLVSSILHIVLEYSKHSITICFMKKINDIEPEKFSEATEN